MMHQEYNTRNVHTSQRIKTLKIDDSVLELAIFIIVIPITMEIGALALTKTIKCECKGNISCSTFCW